MQVTSKIFQLVAAIILFIYASPSNAERWVKFYTFGKSDFDKRTVYFSAEKIKTKDGFMQVWELTDYVVTQKQLDRALLASLQPEKDVFSIIFESVVGDKPSLFVKKYKSRLALVFVDCVERKLAYPEVYDYGDSMGTGEIVHEEKRPREFSIVLPGSDGEKKLETICKAKNK